MTKSQSAVAKRKAAGLCIRTGCKNTAALGRVRCEFHLKEAAFDNKIHRTYKGHSHPIVKGLIGGGIVQ